MDFERKSSCMVKRIIKYLFNKMGYQIQKNRKVVDFTLDGALKRCMSRGLKVNSVIDVGASDGRWTRRCMAFLPGAEYLLIEAQQDHQKGLDILKDAHKNVNYILAAAGNMMGKIYFDNTDLFVGLASETPFKDHCIEVPVVTIDNEIKKRHLPPPYLIKLDTNGFEVPILEGAVDALKKAELVIIETYNFIVSNNSLKYFQMCQYMEKLGFSSVELVDFMIREKDGSFWQMDTFFIPSSNKIFEYNSFK